MITLSAPERVAVAELVGLNEQYLYQCLTRRRVIPADRCPQVERATAGRVTCEELRPDVRWQRVPDPAWPNQDGRPCIDVAAPAPAEAQEASHAA